MSTFGSFTAKFTVTEGAPAKPDFNASEVLIYPNAPPWPTEFIQASSRTSSQYRGFNLNFDPFLGNGDHELEGDEIATFAEGSQGYLTTKSALVKININSLQGTYKGTFMIDMVDNQRRQVIAKGEFDIKVDPKKLS